MAATGDYEESPFVAELYDYVELYRRRADVPFLVQAAIDSGGPVLELGCGTGRTLIPMAEAGVEVVGIERSDHMLQQCRNRLGTLPDSVRRRITLKKADVRSFQLDPVFRLVTAPFRLFQFLHSVEDQIACLRSVHSALRPDSTLLLDLAYPSPELFSTDDLGVEQSFEPEVTLPDGRRVLRLHRYIRKSRLEQTIDFHVIYRVTHPDGSSERLIQRFSMRYLYRYEAEHLLQRCGFEVCNAWAGYDKAPFGSRDPTELILEARNR